jgi:hypothetical protein
MRSLEPLLAGCASNVVFQPGEYLIHEGDEARSFFVICQGRVFVETSAPGRGALPIQTLGPGDILGWSWLVAHGIVQHPVTGPVVAGTGRSPGRPGQGYWTFNANADAFRQASREAEGP